MKKAIYFLKKVIGVVHILITITILFFTPVIWEYYQKVFGIDLTGHFGGMGVFLGILMVVAIFFISGLYLLTHKIDEQK